MFANESRCGDRQDSHSIEREVQEWKYTWKENKAALSFDMTCDREANWLAFDNE